MIGRAEVVERWAASTARARRIACVLIAAILVYATGCGRSDAPPLQFDGHYRASVIDRNASAMAVFFTIHPEAKDNNVPPFALITRVEFVGAPTRTRTADCLVHVLVPHERTWQLSGTVDRSYGTGVDPAIDQLLQQRPDVPRSRDDAGHEAFEGTVFVSNATAKLPPLVAMWQVPDGTKIEAVRVGVASSCNRRLRNFRWLTSDGPFEN